MSIDLIQVDLPHLPKLKDDGSNWATYKEYVVNALAVCGLKRHVMGTVQVPTELVINEYGQPMARGTDKVATDAQIDAADRVIGLYRLKEAQVREVIHYTVSHKTFLKIKDQPTTAKMWSRLAEINENEQLQAETFAKLQRLRYRDGKNMRTHIRKMVELRDRLALMGLAIPDEIFIMFIRTSLTPSYQPLLTALSFAYPSFRISVYDFIQHIYTEFDSKRESKKRRKTRK